MDNALHLMDIFPNTKLLEAVTNDSNGKLNSFVLETKDKFIICLKTIGNKRCELSLYDGDLEIACQTNLTTNEAYQIIQNIV